MFDEYEVRGPFLRSFCILFHVFTTMFIKPALPYDVVWTLGTLRFPFDEKEVS